jgi:prepilin-type N-terminal cleavage/methylation domain-containing protein
MSRPRAQRGFTFLETMVVVAVGALLFGLLGQALSGSANLSSVSRASLLAEDDAQRSVEAIASTLRGASWESLTGFDGNDVATTPGFRRVVGSDASGQVLDQEETLRWRAGRAADGIQSPGEVVLERGGVAAVVAPRVPGGGFRVERTGTTLKVVLTTYASTSQRVVTHATAEALVALRN